MQGNFLFLNLLCICLLGFVTSYTDLKKGLIQNKFVFPAIALAFALNFLNGFALVPFLINGFLAFLLGFMLWLARLWSAGDSKLFLAFALLFPFSLNPQNWLFPSFLILVNSFAPTFLFMLFIVLAKTSSKQKLEALKQAFAPKTVLSVAVFLFSFYWLLDLVFLFFGIRFELFPAAVILFALISVLEFVLPKKSIYFFAVLSLAFLALRFDSVLSPDFLSFFFSFMLLALFFLFFVLRLGLLSFGKKLSVPELRPGMVLLETLVMKNERVEKKEQFYPSFISIFSEIGEKPVVESGPKGLSKEDLAFLVKGDNTRKLGFKYLLVQETLPFAPIIFLGTILSFLMPLLPFTF